MFDFLKTLIADTLLKEIQRLMANPGHVDVLGAIRKSLNFLHYFPHVDLRDGVAKLLEAAIQRTEGEPLQHKLLELGIVFLAIHATGDVQAIAQDVETLEAPASAAVGPTASLTSFNYVSGGMASSSETVAINLGGAGVIPSDPAAEAPASPAITAEAQDALASNAEFAGFSEPAAEATETPQQEPSTGAPGATPSEPLFGQDAFSPTPETTTV